jgi:uncharacterized protein
MPQALSSFSPLAERERLVTLDILRAVALFGVFLMNMEFFTRPLGASGLGIEPGLAGFEYLLAWLEYVLVKGKFWMLFAMLFGMGFAVMSERAAQAERGFAGPYLRRTATLLVLGVAHMVLVWAGDILHAYALAACVLLAILHGRAWWLLLPVPLFLFAWLQLGGRGYLGGVIGFILFACAAHWIGRGHAGRLWRAGAMLYCSVSCVILAMTLPRLFAAPSVEQQAAAAKRAAELQASLARESEISAAGSYLENVALRLRDLIGNLPDETALLVYAVGMFLIGAWFIRAGILRNVETHRALLRRIAWSCLPLGLALALCSVAIAPAYDPQRRAVYTVAAHLMQLASLPLSVGYVAALALLIHGRRELHLRWLAPTGRMALTHYLLQSVLGTLVFYGYGLGLWGRVDRAGQLLMVIAVFALQVIASQWWLQRFRYGPMEWLWRAATYATWPPMLRRSPAEAPVSQDEPAARQARIHES